MKFFTLLALPIQALSAAAAPKPPQHLDMRQVGVVATLPSLDTIPLNVTCATACLEGVTACVPTELTNLGGLVGCPVATVLCAVTCIDGLNGLVSGAAKAVGTAEDVVGGAADDAVGTVGELLGGKN